MSVSKFGELASHLLGKAMVAAVAMATVFASPAAATNFTMNVPGTSLRLPNDYPEAGGVAIVMIGANGNAYYQFSNPTGAFVGYQNSGSPAAFRGNPFTINSPISLDCGASTCSSYFGGSIARLYIRFSADDGDTQLGGFDYNDITLRLNGFDVDNWSNITTQSTNTAGTVAYSTQQGFGNNTFDTGWFQSTNPALLANILSTGQTVTQVYDRDPNDNYWDFRRGNTLTNNNIVTVAPGYSLTKTANRTTFAAVGNTITYTYVVTNIGSVPIRSLSVVDDKIASVSCNKTVIQSVSAGQTPDSATCTATYTVTQADFDAERVTNIARAEGVPDYGSLGVLTATATVTGPAINPSISLQKTSSLSAFGLPGTTVPYNLRVQNTGNATLTNVVVTDPKLPGLSCSFAALAPNAVQNCSGSYTVTQADMDAFASSAATRLSNTASVTSRDPKNVARNATSTLSLPGPTPVLTMSVAKTTTAANFSAVGQNLPYQITIRNTGNVTWPSAPTVTDPLTSVSCPAGAVAPNAAITCSANYAVQQADIDAGKVDNTASATITVGPRTATGSSTVSVPAVRSTGLTLDKRLSLTSPTSFEETGTILTYVYELRNTGNVTLNAVSVTDDRVSVSCPAPTLAPNATMICTSGNYSTTQGNLSSGGVTNTATATATAAVSGTTVTSNTDSVTVPAVQRPVITLDKTAPVLTAAQFTVGRVVTYSYRVRNVGNVRISAADQLTITDDKIGTFNCGSGDLQRNSNRDCTATYTLTEADILAGVVVNEAVANAGTVARSNTDTATIAPSLTPGLSIAKSANVATVSSLSDVISYSFVVTNTGNNSIIRSGNPITVNDPMVGAVNCTSQPATLDPMDSFTCTATYSPTQAQLDSGRVLNSATASYPYSGGGSPTTVTSPSSSATVDVVETAGLTLQKTGPADFSSVGQSLTFNFVVTNTGNTTLTSATVTDPLIPGLSCTRTNIAPLGTASCTGTYTVTQADMDAGVIDNTATAQGRTAQGGTANDTDTASVPVNSSVVLKAASFDKTASIASYNAVGDQILYTLAVQNTGAQTLRNITVTDALDPGYSCFIAVLSPTVTDTSCTFTYTVQQSDIDAGSIVNAASAASADFPSTLTDSETITGPARGASMTFTKSASGPYTAKDDIVTFTLSVTNTGTVSLSNVQITDSFFTPALACTIPTLLPGATNDSCQGSYSVLQSDVDNGQITNTANISASAPAGVTPPAPTTATAIVNGPVAAPAVRIAKVPSAGTYAAINDVISYGFTVTNTGNVTLTRLEVRDPQLGFSCPLDDLAPGASTSVCAGGSPVMSASKQITQADIDRGAFTNTAAVTGQSLVGATAIRDESSVTVTGPAQSPALSLAKASTLGGPFSSLGQQVPYNYTVTNTGNITLTGTITVSDDKIASVSCPALPAAGLPPNDSIVCNGTYTIGQADLDAGFVTNIASASTVQAVIPTGPGAPAAVTVTSPDAQATVNAQQSPALTLDKRIKSSSPSSYAAVNDVVVYEYVVTNTGNVTTTADITIADDKIPGPALVCLSAPLAPLASVTCEQDWTADLAALNAGSVTNTAIASTIYNSVQIDSNADTATVTAVQTPQLGLSKTLVAPVPLNFSVGETLNYQYVVSNPGNVSITGVSVSGFITVIDNLTPVSCPAVTSLDPGATITCTASYSLTPNDIRLGSTTNVATASGEFGGAEVKSPQSSVRFPVTANPALSLSKSTTATGFATLGEVITYSYTVTNPARMPGQPGVDLIEDIFVDDDKIGRFLCRPSSEGVFSVGASFTCTRTYSVTQADLDANSLTNNAIGETLFAKGTTNEIAVASDPESVTLTGSKAPQLQVVKVVSSGPNPAAVGDTLNYTITSTNTGNQTISGVAVTDPLIPALTCTVNAAPAPANVVLAPQQAIICTGSYQVLQSDIDAQVLANTALARGSDPQGQQVSASGGVTHPLVAAAPSVEVTKAIIPAPGPDDAFVAVGQVVTFEVTVRNTGNITLTSTTVTDDLVPGSCTIGPLAPMASDNSCQFQYTVQQSDIDAQFGPVGGRYGGFVNTATGVSQPATPGAPTVEDDGDVFAKGPAREMALTLLKESATPGFSAIGDVIVYDFTVANTGNVTLTDPIFVTDPLLGAAFQCGAMPVGGLPPQDFLTCSRSYTVTQADVDAGFVTNVATVASGEVPLPSDPAAQGSMRSTETVNGSRNPSMTVTKVPSISSGATTGTVITYSYTVRNTGNVTLTNVTPTDQHSSAAGTAALPVGGDALGTDVGEQGNSTDGAPAGVWGQLGPGDDVTFSASYTVTQADIDQGVTLANTVTVRATSPAGTSVADATDSASVAVVGPAGAMTAIKTVNTSGLSSPPVAGDALTYLITLTNTGNVTLSNVVPTDTFLDAKGQALTLTAGPTGPMGDDGDGLLQVGEVWSYTASFTLDQQAVDAGGVSNSVTFAARDPFNTPVQDVSDDDGTNPDDPTVTNLLRRPVVTLVKAAVLNDGGDGRTDAGDSITYSYTLRNEGNVTLFDAALVETGFTGTGATPVPVLQSGGADLDGDGDAIDLAPQASATYEVTYTLTQADIDALGVTNQATVTVTDPDGVTRQDRSGSTTGNDIATVVAIAPAAAMDVQKRADTAALGSPVAVGDVIDYTISVENIGNVTLSSVSLADTLLDARGAGLTLTSAPVLSSGDDGDGLLEVGETWVYSASFALNQQAIDAGGVSNSATVTATVPGGGTVSDISDDDGTNPSDPTVTVLAHAPQMLAIKTVTEALSTPPSPGDLLTYDITIENTGNVSLTSVALTDTLSNAAGTNLSLLTGPIYQSGDASPAGVLDVGETWSFTATYRLSQADIDAGGVQNTLRVDAVTPGTVPVTEVSDDDGIGADDPTVTTIARTPRIAALKSASFDAGADGIASAGDVITYSYTVQNTGNVTVLDVGLTETGFTGTGPVPVPAYVSGGANLGGNAGIIDLGVGQSALWRVTYALTQADVDAGGVTNQALASGLDPAGSPVTDQTGATTGDNLATQVTLPRQPSLNVEKTADTSGLSSPVVAGDSVGFTVRVANTGNVTLNTVTLADTFTRRNGATLSLALSKTGGDAAVVGVLEVGETWVYTGTHVLTQADIDAGGVQNTVTVQATAPGGATVSDVSDDGDDADGNTTDDPTVVAVQAQPSLGLTKVLAPGSTAPYTSVGENLTYQFTVTNTGNITITAPLVITDPLITNAGGSVTCSPPPIAPNGTASCTGSYAIQLADLDNGSVLNTAIARVTQPVVPATSGGPTSVVVTSPSADVTAYADQRPALTIDKRIKASSASSYAAVGDRVTFEYVVRNSGNVTLPDAITVTDDKIAGVLACAAGPLAPMAQVICEQDWVATQADLDLVPGQVTNSAYAETTFGATVVTSTTDTATISAVQSPSLSMVKTLLSATPNLFDVGTVLSYQFVVTNTGNVTIDGPITIADSITTANCNAVPAGGLAPMATVNCTASYTLRPGDIALGSTVNVATASGGFGGSTVTSPSDDAIYPVSAAPTLSVVKDSDPANVTFDRLGQLITYSYTVTNTGGAAYSEAIDIDDDVIGRFTCLPDTAAVFGVGDVHTCNATYSVVQADLDRGFVTNEASAKTIFAPGTPNEIAVTSPVATKTVNALPDAVLTVEKSVIAGPNPAALNDVLTYRILARNDGNQTLRGVTVSDSRIAGLSCTFNNAPVPANVVLLPTELVECVGDYTVTQADIDAQSLTNTASARGTDPQGQSVSGVDMHNQPVVAALAGLEVEKTLLPDPGAAPAFTQANEVLTFVVTLRNTGNVTLNALSVTDDRVPGTCNLPTLLPGTSNSACQFTYTTTQADVDAVNGGGAVPYGGFVNTATGVAMPANPGATQLQDQGSVFVRGPDHAPAFDLVKTSDISTAQGYGDTITYTYVITNAGNITLRAAPVLTDDKIGTVSCPALPAAGLLPGAQLQCQASYSVTQTDADAGFVTNIASVVSPEVTTPATDTVTVTIQRGPGLRVDKSASITSGARVGDVITYTYTVTNTGNVLLNAVSLVDQHSSAAGTAALTIGAERLVTDAGQQGNATDAAVNGIWDQFGPGDVVAFTSSYTVTQADIDAGNPISNIVEVTATGPAGTTPPVATDRLSIPVEAGNPALAAIKTYDAGALSSPPVAGELVNYSISIENTGNVTLNAVQLQDRLRRVDATPLMLGSGPTYQSGNGATPALEVGETWLYSASYRLTQADIDAGGISNQVTVTATGPGGVPVRDLSDDGLPGGADDPTLTQIPASPSIEGQKVIVTPAVAVGEVITFEITATNTGNVTLTNVGIPSDRLTRANGDVLTLTSAPGFTGASMGSGLGTLLPGEVATYRATYQLVQADLDAGGVLNSATVSGQPPIGAPVTDISDDGDDSDGNTTDDPTVQVIVAQPALSLVKALAAGSGPLYNNAGQVLTYEFRVTNSGNVTITAPITIDDPMLGAAFTCGTLPASGLAPQAVQICTAPYTVLQSDIDAGRISNTATAHSGPTSSAPSTLITDALQSPMLTVVKDAGSVPPAAFVTGQVVSYTYTVTNSGNVTVTSPVSISDNRIAASDISCPALPVGGLAPAGTLVCTATYSVTAADVDLGTVTNLATATDGRTVSPIVTETIPDNGMPALQLVKSSTTGSFATLGDTIRYSYVVTNIGTRAFAAPVDVVDDVLGQIACFAPTAQDPDFTSGESVTCNATHTVTQADLDRGAVTNQAYARTTFGSGAVEVVSDPDSVTVAASLNPALSLIKTSSPNPVSAVGQVVTYSIVARNSGNQSLGNVRVTDPLLPGLACTTAVLTPGQSLPCSGSYVVRQADVDRGTLVNTAFVSGITPQGGLVRQQATETTAMPAPAPAVSLTKTATPSPFGAVGSNVTYIFAAQNTGNVTLSNLTVTDPMDSGFACTITSLAPGAVDQTCRLTLAVTQAQVDAGAITNTASIAGEDPKGTPVTGIGSVTTQGPARVPGIELTKVLLPSASTVGSPVRFQLLMRNTGNVTLDPDAPIDMMFRLDNTPIALDAPFALVGGDGGQAGLLDVGETWIYTATRTLTQADINAGGFRNSAFVRAEGPGGGVVTDISDNGNDGDGNTVDDPTVFSVNRAPGLDVTKIVTSSTGNGLGDTITFGIEAVNIGNVTLTGITLADTMTRADGSLVTGVVATGGASSLAPGGSAVWTVVHTITQDDIDAGGLENTAIVTGTAPDTSTVSDQSNDGDNGDGNTTDDPTVVTITPAPALTVIKTLDSIGVAAGDDAVFTIVATNSGTVTLTSVAVTDQVTQLGTGLALATPTPQFIGNSAGSPAGTLRVGEEARWTVRYTLTQADIDEGGISNTAVVTSRSPTGGVISDRSDDDGVGPDDPTLGVVALTPALELVKAATTPDILFPTIQRVTFSLTVRNTGNITQTGIRVQDDLAAFLGTGQLAAGYPVMVTATGFGPGAANPAYDGLANTETLTGNATLAPGDAGLIEITLVYAGAATGTNIGTAGSTQLSGPVLSNPVTIVTQDTDGDGIPDLVEGSGDRDNDGVPNVTDYEPTGSFYCQSDGRLLSGGRVAISGPFGRQDGVGTSNGITIVRDGSDGRFQFHVTQAGSYTLEITYPPGSTASTTRLSGGVLDVTSLLPSNPGSLGSGENGSSARLVDFSAGANRFFTTFQLEAGDPFVINNNIPLESCNGTPDILATKTADRSSVVFGESVNFTLVFENNTAQTYAGANLIDMLPDGLVYTPGSGQVDGVAANPVVTGNRLAFGPVTVAPAQRIEVRLAARVSASGSYGSLTNRAWMEDSNGSILSNVATATVKVTPEAVFDCSDIIGKVFDDKNRNGYQDARGGGEVTDQDIFIDKLGKLARPKKPADTSEPGLPGVRLATVNGLLITTDAYGRFHVPCAALPKKIGSNFALKVDTRTLPQGYRMTTENPRVLRVTPGKVAKMNFGATLSNIIDIDLTQAAFVTGTADVSAGFEKAVKGLVQRIKAKPTALQLSYLLQGNEDRALAAKRLKAAEDVIRRAWRGVGRYQLEIERSVKRVQ